MEIIQYRTELDENKKTKLVEEKNGIVSEDNILDDPEKVQTLINGVFNAVNLAEEYVWLIALDTKFHPIGLFEISHGPVNMSVVTPREIFIRLCLCGASMFIIVHNHPSGLPQPSMEDENMTTRIAMCAELMAIKFVDHVIIGREYFSMKQTLPELFNIDKAKIVFT